MKAIRLQTENLYTPLGLDTPSPRFSWNCEGGKRQSAWQILAVRGGQTIWDSGKVLSSSMTNIPYQGVPLQSRDHVEWTITLWDEKGEKGESASSWFEMGLLRPEDWGALWISGDYKPRKKQRYPVDCFQKHFSLPKPIKQARLYSAARGLYDVTINGKRLEEWILAPGMTDYRKRIQYQTLDITPYLQEENTLKLRLADGWFRGSVAAYGVVNTFGTQTSLLAQLEILYADGRRETLVTDESWNYSHDGPLRFADLKDGEIYDATLTPSFSGRVKTVPAPKGVSLCASGNVPVTEHEHLKPVLLPKGVLDFGQNIAGYLSFSLKGKKGQQVKFICGEVLDKDGQVDLSGIQEDRPAKGWNQINLIQKLLTGKVKGAINPTPRQEILFTCSGNTDTYKTSFAIFGFRYVQVVGDIEIHPQNYTAIAVYSDLEETGGFTCSDERVNKLFQNTLWSMKGNFLDVPTDCPTRERLGWTGDAQIFFNTGAYLMNTAPFFRKWLRDMADNQYENGLISAVVPYCGVEMMYKATGSSVGWADAIYLIPWRYYLRYGDQQVLEDSWPMIERFATYLLQNLGMRDKKEAKENPDNAYTYEKGIHLGEWLEPEEFRDKVYGSKAKHPEECTAYLSYGMDTIAKIAKLLGKPYEKYEEVAKGARRAYLRFAELDTDRQAKLVRPLALGLLEGETKKKAEKRLVKAIKDYRYRVGTGFLSTPFLLPVLTQAGEIEVAYRILLNTEKPGWLGEIMDGATTIWENWEGNLSQNHYSPGAVCEWLFDTCAGIRVEGENHFLLCPTPGGELTNASATYLSPYGRVEASWKKEDEGITYTFTVPANCTATICLMDGRREEVGAGVYTF